MMENQKYQQISKTGSHQKNDRESLQSGSDLNLNDQKGKMTKEEYEAGESLDVSSGQQQQHIRKETRDRDDYFSKIPEEQRIPSSADWPKEPVSQRGDSTNSGDEMEDDDEYEIDEIGDDQAYDDEIISGEEDDDSPDDFQNRRKQDNNPDHY